MRERSRALAFCGVLCALAVTVLLLCGLIPAAVYCCPILAMVVLLPVREEYGCRRAVMAYAVTAVTGLLLLPDREIAGLYLFLGWYPAAQPGLDRLRPAALRVLCKLALCDLAAAALYALLLFLFQLEALTQELQTLSRGMLAALALSANALFLMTDLALHRMAWLWRRRLRQRWLPPSLR